MLSKIRATITRINEIHRLWAMWESAVRSRIFPPVPAPELNTSDAPWLLRRTWNTARARTITQLKRALSPEDFQEAISVTNTRTEQWRERNALTPAI